MTNVIRMNSAESADMQAVLDALATSVRTALSCMTNAQLKELMMQPYREVSMDLEMQQRKAA